MNFKSLKLVLPLALTLLFSVAGVSGAERVVERARIETVEQGKSSHAQVDIRHLLIAGSDHVDRGWPGIDQHHCSSAVIQARDHIFRDHRHAAIRKLLMAHRASSSLTDSPLPRRS